MTSNDDSEQGNFHNPDFHSPRYIGFFFILMLSTILSSLCSFIVVRVCNLLLQTTRHKGHLKLINAMSVSQFIYDVSFFFAVAYVGVPGIFDAATICQRIFGCFATLFTNYIAFVAYYSVSQKVFVNVNRYYSMLILISLIPGLIDACLYMDHEYQNHANWFYFWFRVASIVVNMFLCGLIFFNIHKIRSNKTIATSHDKILFKLAVRMMYYPVVQALSRSCIAWYEYDNRFVFSPFSCHTTSDYVSLLIAITLNPCASYGYLAIFFIMQPKAFAIFRKETYIGHCSCWNIICCFLPKQILTMGNKKEYMGDDASNPTVTGLTPTSTTNDNITANNSRRYMNESNGAASVTTATTTNPGGEGGRGEKGVYVGSGSLFDREFEEDDDYLIDLYSGHSVQIMESTLNDPFVGSPVTELSTLP